MKYSLLAVFLVTFAGCTDTANTKDEIQIKNELPALPTKEVDTTKPSSNLIATKNGWTGVQKMNEEVFRSKVLNASGLTLVDFSAEWCGPCKKMEPILHLIAKEMDGKMNFANVDVDESPNIASELEIRSIPLLIFYKNGKVADQLIGLQTKESLKMKIQELLLEK